MKSLKKYFLGCLASVLGVLGFASCQDDFDNPTVDAPVAAHQATISIKELKEQYWQDADNYCDTIKANADGSHVYISGRVISSDEQSNVFKSLIIQDETGALAMSINSYNLYLKYRRGQEIVLDVTGMYIGKYAGLQQLGMPGWYENGNTWQVSFMSPEFFASHIELNGFPEVAEVDTLVVNNFNEIESNPEGLRYWQSQIVRFNNVQFANGGTQQFSEYHSSGVNQAMYDANGNSLNIRTSGYSTFWNNTLPTERGDVVGILSYYNGAWQIILNDYEGCMNFGNPTTAPGTENTPFTVAQAIQEQAAGHTTTGWVEGYIVGTVAPEVVDISGDRDIEWGAEATLANTMVIGQAPDTKTLTEALVIALPSGSDLQALGALRDNPDNYGRKILIRGTLAEFMGTYGITGNTGTASEFQIEGVSSGKEPIANGDGSELTPFSAAQVVAGSATGTSAWVKGYIVGFIPDKYASEAVFGADATVQTNVMIAATPDETDYNKCVPLQLPAGAIRTALNLQSHPENYLKVVSVQGSIEKYFGQMGVKALTAYAFEDGESPAPPAVDGDGSETSPFNVADVKAGATGTDVWVKAYIVGWVDGQVLADGAKFTVPATVQTNILVAAQAGVTDVNACIPVQLPVGDIRTNLNLQAHPENLGKEVMLRGSLERYFGTEGIKSVSAYKLDGTGSGTPATPSDPVSALNVDFESGAIPAGWTQTQVAGNKSWYVTSFSDNYYAAMTGYKGTAPFDQWLVSPAIDMSKVSDKNLTFRTQVNGYGSTTSVFEVYVLTDADPVKGTKTKLNPTIATAPASGYSDWANSGNVSLAAYSGTIYIGFRYAATQDANYATWCVDDIKLGSGSTNPGNPDTPVTPPVTSDEYKGNFNSFNDGKAKASPYGTYTNATGWTATNSIILSGSDTGTDANPAFAFIGNASTLAVNLNGKSGSCGTLTSPTLTGGCGTLTFKYGAAYSDTKMSFTVNIKQGANIVKTITVEPASFAKFEVMDFNWEVNVKGDFVIEIINNGPSASTSNKDRVAIWNLTWTE